MRTSRRWGSGQRGDQLRGQASKLRQQEQSGEQLQQGLKSRIIIEQAKGITAHQHTISVDQAHQHNARAHPKHSVFSSGDALNLGGRCPVSPGPSI